MLSLYFNMSLWSRSASSKDASPVMGRLQLVKYITHPGNKWHHVWAWRTSAYKLVYLGSWFRGSTCVHLVNIAIERRIILIYMAFIWKKHWNKNIIRLYPLDYGWKMKDGDRPLKHCRSDRNLSIADNGRKRMTPISTTTTGRKKSIRRWRGSACWWSSSSADSQKTGGDWWRLKTKTFQLSLFNSEQTSLYL